MSAAVSEDGMSLYFDGALEGRGLAGRGGAHPLGCVVNRE